MSLLWSAWSCQSSNDGLHESVLFGNGVAG